MTRNAVTATVLVVILSGCEAKSPTPVEANAPRPAKAEVLEFPVQQTPAECERAGGEWKAWCAPDRPGCVMPYPDGGRKCSNSSECSSGVCMVDNREECEPGKGCKPLAQPKTGDPVVGICKRESVTCELAITVEDGRARNPYDPP